MSDSKEKEELIDRECDSPVSANTDLKREIIGPETITMLCLNIKEEPANLEQDSFVSAAIKVKHEIDIGAETITDLNVKEESSELEHDSCVSANVEVKNEIDNGPDIITMSTLNIQEQPADVTWSVKRHRVYYNRRRLRPGLNRDTATESTEGTPRGYEPLESCNTPRGRPRDSLVIKQGDTEDKSSQEGGCCESVGTNFEPAGTSCEPAGASCEPTGASYEPVGTNFEPAGPSCEPEGMSCEPAGASCESARASFEPEGTSCESARVSFEPEGTSCEPAGASCESARASFEPAGASCEPAGAAPTHAAGDKTGHDQWNMESEPERALFKQMKNGDLHDSSGQMRIHSGKVFLYECSVCCNKFTELSELSAHIEVHTQQNPHQCSVCGKTFADTYRMFDHMQIHNGKVMYECKLCGKKFGYFRNLSIHMRIHKGTLPNVRCYKLTRKKLL